MCVYDRECVCNVCVCVHGVCGGACAATGPTTNQIFGYIDGPIPMHSGDLTRHQHFYG